MSHKDNKGKYYERLKTYMMIIIEKKEVYLMNELLTQSDFNDLQGFLFFD